MFYYNYVDKCNVIGKSPSAAAEDMGFQRSVVTRWSKGAVPRQATLQKIADYFGCDISDLLKERAAAPEGDGLTADQRNLMSRIPTMSPSEVTVLLAVAKAQEAAQQVQDTE